MKLEPKYSLLSSVLNLNPNQPRTVELSIQTEDEQLLKAKLNDLFELYNLLEHQDNILYVLFGMLDFLWANYGNLAKKQIEQNEMLTARAQILHIVKRHLEENQTSLKLVLTLSADGREIDKAVVSNQRTMNWLANTLSDWINNEANKADELGQVNLLGFKHPLVPITSCHFKGTAVSEKPILFTERQIYGVASFKVIEYLDKQTDLKRKSDRAYNNSQLGLLYRLYLILGFTESVANGILFMKGLLTDTAKYVVPKVEKSEKSR